MNNQGKRAMVRANDPARCPNTQVLQDSRHPTNNKGLYTKSHKRTDPMLHGGLSTMQAEAHGFQTTRCATTSVSGYC